MVDDYTFGNSPAAIVMAQMLNRPENTKIRSKVTKIAENADIDINAILSLTNIRLKDRRRMINTLAEKHIASVNEWDQHEVKTFLLNYITMRKKVAIKSIAGKRGQLK